MGAELWKQCGDWLVRLQVLPTDHQICLPNATVQDLAYALRDGVLLCHLVFTIDPNTIDMKLVNQRPSLAQFLCLKNIRRFLTACSKHFEMKETDLFQPSMLYDYTDFGQVLHTLSRLSLTSRALAKCHPGFPVSSTFPSHQEEQIYKTLEDLVTESQYTDFYNKHLGGELYARRSSQYFNLGEKEEDIYEDLCSFNSTNRQLLNQIQSIQPVEKRDYILKELLETESNYVDVLNMLRKHFIKPITSIKDTDKKIVFMNIKELGENHAGFYKDIREAIMGKPRKKVGEVFITHKDRFLKYGEYCAHLPRAQQLLESLCSKSELVREEICRCEQSAKGGKFRLGDLLAVPMQRILKYHLLLRELLHNTPQSHEEYHTVHQAYEAMLDVSDFVNEVKRDSEQLQIIREIQVSITDWNMPPGVELCDYGRLRKDSELKMQAHDTATKKVRYVFVFDKMLLVCKQTRGDHYSFKQSLKVSDYKLEDVSSRRLSKDTKWAYSFLIVHKDNLHAYTMYARTEEKKQEWIEAFSEALDNVLPDLRLRSTHHFAMHNFERPTSCNYCYKLLKGLFYQGYFCDRCNRSSHKQCIQLLSKCGILQPPALPPRPPSIQLPCATGDLNRLSSTSLVSTVSIDEPLASLNVCSNSVPTGEPSPSSVHPQTDDTLTAPASLGLFPAVKEGADEGLSPSANPTTPTTPNMRESTSLPPITLSSMSSFTPDYVNTRIDEHPWYMGEMERETANTKLKTYPVGTYLVRTRIQAGEVLGHALSLRTEDDTKHMKINTCEEDTITRYYLSDSRTFRSIVELISWFSQNSLKESFTGLDTKLRFPFKDLILVTAIYDYNPEPSETNMLSLRSGDTLSVWDKQDCPLGWWKAVNLTTNRSRIGYIPKDFVQICTD